MDILIGAVYYTYSQDIFDVDLKVLASSAHQITCTIANNLLPAVAVNGVRIVANNFDITFKLDALANITTDASNVTKLNLFSSIFNCKNTYPAFRNTIRKVWLSESINKVTGLNVRLVSPNVQIKIDISAQNNWEILKAIMSTVELYEYTQIDDKTIIVGLPDDIASVMPTIKVGYSLNGWQIKDYKKIEYALPYSHVSISSTISGADITGIVEHKDIDTKDKIEQYQIDLIAGAYYVVNSTAQQLNVFSQSINTNIAENTDLKNIYDLRVKLYKLAVKQIKSSLSDSYEVDMAYNSIALPFTNLDCRVLNGFAEIKLNKRLLEFNYTLTESIT